jgi:hypothetical protein
MYMDFNFDIKNDFVFTTDNNGVLKGGGFVIQSELLSDTIQSIGDMPQSGGGPIGASLLNTFKDLAVPAGLFFTQKQVQKNNTINYEHKAESIGDGIYDKLLGMLEPSKRKLHGRKTKSKRENGKKNTRKNR